MALEIEGSNPSAHPIFIQILRRGSLSIKPGSPLWNPSTNPFLKDLHIVRNGDEDGYNMVLHITLESSVEVFAISLPHLLPNRTGPTWSYLVNNDGWTLIDAGPYGALPSLEAGLDAIGKKVTDIERVIISHGHQDHDGNTYDLIEKSGAVLWAQEMYFFFLGQHSSYSGLNSNSLLHKSILEFRKHTDTSPSKLKSDYAKYRSRFKGYDESKQKIIKQDSATHPIKDGDSIGKMTFLYTPGHSVDEICIDMDGVLFTGDHILPQITPHPTIVRKYPEDLMDKIPDEYKDSSNHYGLYCYLSSLGKTLKLNNRKTVLPAHRLFNNNKFNIRNLLRGKDIILHHSTRLKRILNVIESGVQSPPEITRKLFPPRKLIGGGFFAALSEIVSHLEMLDKTKDIQILPNGNVKSTKQNNFLNVINKLLNHN